jgi:hypothetical protein
LILLLIIGGNMAGLKGQIIETILKMLEGKEAKAKINLNGVKFKIGKSQVQLAGTIDITFVPLEKRK